MTRLTQEAWEAMAAEQGLDAAQAEQMVEIAEHEHCNDDIAIDPNPLLSVGNDGCWVQGWMWIRFPDSMLEPEDATEEEPL